MSPLHFLSLFFNSRCTVAIGGHWRTFDGLEVTPSGPGLGALSSTVVPPNKGSFLPHDSPLVAAKLPLLDVSRWVRSCEGYILSPGPPRAERPLLEASVS